MLLLTYSIKGGRLLSIISGSSARGNLSFFRGLDMVPVAGSGSIEGRRLGCRTSNVSYIIETPKEVENLLIHDNGTLPGEGSESRTYGGPLQPVGEDNAGLESLGVVRLVHAPVHGCAP